MSSDEQEEDYYDEPSRPEPGPNSRVQLGETSEDYSSVDSNAIDLVLEEKRVATAHPDKVRAAMGLTEDSASLLPTTTRKEALTPGAHPVSGLALAPTTRTSAEEFLTQEAPRNPSEMTRETEDNTIVIPHATIVLERNARIEEETYDPEKLVSLTATEVEPAATVVSLASDEGKKTDGGGGGEKASKRKFQVLVVVALFLVVALLSVILVLVLREPKNNRLAFPAGSQPSRPPGSPPPPGNGNVGNGDGQGGGRDREGEGGQEGQGGGGNRFI